MDKLALTTKYYLFQVALEIAEICQPLNTQYGITNFNHMRIFNNHWGYVLINNQPYLSYHIEKRYLILPYLPIHLPSTSSI